MCRRLDRCIDTVPPRDWFNDCDQCSGWAPRRCRARGARHEVVDRDHRQPRDLARSGVASAPSRGTIARRNPMPGGLAQPGGRGRSRGGPRRPDRPRRSRRGRWARRVGGRREPPRPRRPGRPTAREPRAADRGRVDVAGPRYEPAALASAPRGSSRPGRSRGRWTCVGARELGGATLSACTSASSGRRPSIVTVTHVPATGWSCRETNRPVGSGTSTMPSSTRSKQPISSTGPKRFLTARSRRSRVLRSPSNCSTTSTRCSSTRGPATEPSLVTWPTRRVGDVVASWRAG